MSKKILKVFKHGSNKMRIRVGKDLHAVKKKKKMNWRVQSKSDCMETR